MSTTFAISSAILITIVVCGSACALMLPSASTHRVWAARWARTRANRASARAARALARAQTRAARAQVQASRARAAWREVNKG